MDVKGQGLDLCDVLDDQEDVDETKMPLGHETIYLRGTEEGDPVKARGGVRLCCMGVARVIGTAVLVSVRGEWVINAALPL